MTAGSTISLNQFPPEWQAAIAELMRISDGVLTIAVPISVACDIERVTIPAERLTFVLYLGPDDRVGTEHHMYITGGDGREVYLNVTL